MRAVAVDSAAPWSSSAAAVAESLSTDLERGLAPDEAAHRLAGGANVLPVSRPPSLRTLVLAQLRDTMILVLLGAAALSAATGDFADTLIITIVVALNTTLGVQQQRRAQRAIAALASLTVPTARVVRGGAVAEVSAQDVVVGDVVELAAGDLVPADGRLSESEALSVDEAMLTGESVPAAKSPEACPSDSPVADRASMLHAGTLVTHGTGRLVVTATAEATQVGRLAHLLVTGAAPATPLQLQLAQFGRQVAAATLALCALVLVIGLVNGQGAERMLLTGISLAVAAIPESLPAVVVLSLALSAQRMAVRSAVVRTLPAVEALGSVTVIASDKTGTLTQNRMVATGCWTSAGEVIAEASGYAPVGGLRGTPDALAAAEPLLRAAALCNDARLVHNGEWRVVGDPMEGALLALAAKGGQRRPVLAAQWPRIAAYSFDHARARMTTVHRTPDGGVAVFCKGAPEVLLELVDGDTPRARDEVARMAARGLRVLAVATATRSDAPRGVDDAEAGLRLVGLVGLQDPPRDAAAAAVARCRSAGVVPIMITGDHPATAAAIARSVGILDEGAQVATGADVAAGLSAVQLRDNRVYARIAPEQKLDIVTALQAAGHVVAMTGDGVNDAPALRSADVGVAMGRSGTEVARQAADIVLVDDDFATIVAAVEEGRRVYDNVRRFLLYALSGGTAEVLLMLLGPAFGLALPLLPGQILWVNMLTHGLPGVALGAEQAEDDVLDRPPRSPQQGVLGDGLAGRIALLATIVAAASLSVGIVADRTGHPWQSMVFVTLTLAQLGIALALRSQQRSVLRVGLRGNPLLLGSVALNVGLLLLAVTWWPLRDLLGTEPLSAGELAVCLAASLVAPLSVELAKAVRRISARTRPGTFDPAARRNDSAD